MFGKKDNQNDIVKKKVEAVETFSKELVKLVKLNYNKNLDFSENSLKDIDEILESQKKKNLSEQACNLVVKMFGSYFGQVLVKNLKGRWALTREGVGMIN